MCGRYTLQDAIEFLEKVFGFSNLSDLKPRYNIAPSQNVLVVRCLEGKNEAGWLRWGLIPSWAKDTTMSARMINARAESLEEKPSFKNAFKKRRCLIIADGFYEWHKTASTKQPYYIKMSDSKPFAFAGLWEKWSHKDEVIESCTIVTTQANLLLASIHDRMPVILNPQDYKTWLNPAEENINTFKSLLRPYAEEKMVMYSVSNIVNSAKNDIKDCISPLCIQKSLF